MSDSQSRMRELVRVNNDLTSNLDLPTVLRRIVEIGVDLVGARYGAIGVVSQERRLEQFIHVGMDPEAVARIGHLPEGKGLLGALIDDPRPVRLASIATDARSSGFPAGHPPMDSFIGVPIRVRGAVFGNLYLTDSTAGQFSADDEELAEALAASAGIAIQNARLFEDAEYRARWSTALVDVSRRLMLADEGDESDELDLIIGRLSELAQADLVTVSMVRGPDGVLVVERAIGLGADRLRSTAFPISEALAAGPLRTGEPTVLTMLADHPSQGYEEQSMLGNAMLVPFAVGGTTAGLLCVARTKGRTPFVPRDLDMGVSFAGHVSLALDRADVRRTRRRVALLEDRTRIARDLHDHVIQHLFATGLNLQAAAAGADGPTAARIIDQVQEIDDAITQIRQSIFAISRDSESTASSLRARILEIVDRTVEQLHQKPRVTFLGPIDLMANATLADDVAAVVTEALANAVKHAAA
ncbi:MAG: GAF domain-containing protein, partial [Actinomycetales bacterium]